MYYVKCTILFLKVIVNSVIWLIGIKIRENTIVQQQDKMVIGLQIKILYFSSYTQYCQSKHLRQQNIHYTLYNIYNSRIIHA